MTKGKPHLSEPFTMVDIPQITKVQRTRLGDSLWVKRLTQIPDGKALRYEFNNRQRAHQVANSIKNASRQTKIPVVTRTYHGIPEIHGTDKWLLYVWRKKDEGKQGGL